MTHDKKEYCYLVERKYDKEKFVMFGNLKLPWIGITPLYFFVSNTYEYAKNTPFGLVSNVSSDLRYNSKE